jgi:hypothetical protein
MPFIVKTKNLGQTQTTQTLAPTPHKPLLNTATRELNSSNINHNIQTFIQGLTSTASTDYSLWKAIHFGLINEHVRGLTLKRSFANLFLPHPSENFNFEGEALTHYLETPYQLDPPHNHHLRSEVYALPKVSIQKNHLRTTLSVAKSFKNYQ